MLRPRSLFPADRYLERTLLGRAKRYLYGIMLQYLGRHCLCHLTRLTHGFELEMWLTDVSDTWRWCEDDTTYHIGELDTYPTYSFISPSSHLQVAA